MGTVGTDVPTSGRGALAEGHYARFSKFCAAGIAALVALIASSAAGVAVEQGILGVLFLALAGLGLVVFFVRPRFWVDLLLLLTVIVIPLQLYVVPLVAGQELQILRAILLLSIVAWVCALPTIRRRVPAFVVLQTPFIALAVYSTVVHSVDPGYAITYLVSLAFGFLYCLWLPQVVHDERTVRLLFVGIIGAGCVVLLFALYQFIAFFTGAGLVNGFFVIVPFSEVFVGTESSISLLPTGPLFRLALPYQNSVMLGSGVAAILLATLPLHLILRNRRWQRLGLLLIHVGLFGVLLTTFSRGAWLGFAAGAFALLLSDRRLRLNKQLWIVGIVVFLALVVTLLAVPSVRETIAVRVDSSTTDASNIQHVEFRLGAIRMWLEKPLFGIGMHNYLAQTGNSAHTIYLTVLTELGFFGLLLFLLWLGAVFVTAVKAQRLSRGNPLLSACSSGLLAALVALYVNNFLQPIFYHAHIWLVFGAIGAVYFVARKGRADNVHIGSQIG